MPRPRTYNLLDETGGSDDDSLGGRVRRSIAAGEDEMDRKIRELGARERRRFGRDSTVRISFLQEQDDARR
jgi:hypothetical protein